jgi:hypothetical protein
MRKNLHGIEKRLMLSLSKHAPRLSQATNRFHTSSNAIALIKGENLGGGDADQAVRQRHAPASTTTARLHRMGDLDTRFILGVSLD